MAVQQRQLRGRKHKRAVIVLAAPGLAVAACGGSLLSPQQQAGGDAGAIETDSASLSMPDVRVSPDVEQAETSVDGAAVEDAQPEPDSAADASGDAEDAASSDAQIDGARLDAADAAEAAVPISCAETASCAHPISLGTMIGGSSVDVGTARGLGSHAEWYQVEIVPDTGSAWPPDSNIPVNLGIEYPISGQSAQLGTAFYAEMYIDTGGPPTTCTQPVASTMSDSGANQEAIFLFPNNKQPVIGWLTIHVIAEPGSQCTSIGSDWAFIVETDE